MPRITNQTVTERDLQEMQNRFEEMAKKPKRIKLQEALVRLAPAIKAMIKQGYSLRDVCGVMEEYGIKISEPALRKMLEPDQDEGKKPAEPKEQPVTKAVDEKEQPVTKAVDEKEQPVTKAVDEKEQPVAQEQPGEERRKAITQLSPTPGGLEPSPSVPPIDRVLPTSTEPSTVSTESASDRLNRLRQERRAAAAAQRAN